MSNDLDLYQSGQVAPWDPAGQPLAPTADSWDQTDDIDYLSDHQIAPISHGLPANVEQNLLQIVGIFYSDMSSLGHPASHIEAAANWFKRTLVNPPTSMQAKKHGYPSEWQYSADPIWRAFANFMWTLGATPQFMETCAYWCGELEKRLDQVAHGDGAPAQLSAQGSATYSDPLDSLSDADFERVQQLNLQAQSNTKAYLQRKWGQSYLANMNTLQAYFQALPIGEQQFLNQYDRNWINGLNSVAVLEGLFANAVGSGSLPSGGGVQAEISSIEAIMGTKAYRKDERLQARLRVLYGLRDGN